MENKSIVKESMINTVKQTIECLETSLAADVCIRSVFDLMVLAASASGDDADGIRKVFDNVLDTIQTGVEAKKEVLNANRALLQIFEL